MFDRAGEWDAETILYALSQGNAGDRKKIIEGYESLLRSASPRERDSVLSQFKFLKQHITGDPLIRIDEIFGGLEQLKS